MEVCRRVGCTKNAKRSIVKKINRFLPDFLNQSGLGARSATYSRQIGEQQLFYSFASFVLSTRKGLEVHSHKGI